MQYTPPLYDFKQWIDTGRGPDAIDFLPRQIELRKWEKEMRNRRMAEREREEEIKRRRKEKLRKKVEKHEEERERKRERSRHAKATLEEGDADAVRKGKWPRCMQ